MKLRTVFGLLAFVQAVLGAGISPELTRVIAEKFLAKEPAPVLEKGFSMEEGLRAQSAFVDLLKPNLGPVAGYKVGLITKAGGTDGRERAGAWRAFEEDVALGQGSGFGAVWDAAGVGVGYGCGGEG